MSTERASVADPVAGTSGETFEALYRRQWTPMVRFAALTTGSVALAEEIVQDAFADVHRAWARVDVPAAYLRRSVANRCTSWVRRQRLERRVTADRPVAATDDRVVELLDALGRLSPRQRAAIVLRHLDDLPEAEIAEVLACRPGTVKSLLARGLARLREEIPS